MKRKNMIMIMNNETHFNLLGKYLHNKYMYFFYILRETALDFFIIY